MAVPYGDFLAEGPLPGTASGCVLEARQRGSVGTLDSVVKRFPLDPAVLPEDAERARAVKQRMAVILLQDQAVQNGANHVAPLMDFGTRGFEVWYVTRRYEQSLAGYLAFLEGRPAPGKIVWQILLGVTRGALALSLTDSRDPGTRRAHGNLKLSNVLLSSVRSMSVRDVVVSDPAVGTSEAQEFERNDGMAIGRMLVQLVLGRVVADSEDWAALRATLERPDVAWRKPFGKRAETWRRLAFSLLGGTGDAFTLADLEEKLISLEPVPPPKVPWMLIAGLLVATLAWGGGLWSRRPKLGVLEVVSNPAGAVLAINGNPVGVTRFRTNLSPGDWLLELQFTNRFKYLQPTNKRVKIKAGDTLREQFDFPFTELSFTSRKLGVDGIEVRWRRDGSLFPLGLTPLYDVALPPGTQVFEFALTGYRTVQQTNAARAGMATNLLIDLVRIQEGLVEITFESQIRSTEFNYKDITNSRYLDLPQSSPVPVRVLFPAPWPSFTTNLITGLTKDIVRITPPHGWLRMEGTGEAPGEAELLVKTASGLVAFGKLGDPEFAWPEGDYEVQVQLLGYETNTMPVRIVTGQTNAMSVELKAMFGFIDVTANLEGTRLFTRTNDVEIPLDVEVLGGVKRRVPLFPNMNHDLIARYDTGQGLLDPVIRRIQVKPGEQTVTNFDFAFATLELVPDPTNAMIRLEDRAAPLTNRVRYLRPDTNYSFTATAEHFVPLTTNVTLAARSRKTLALQLRPQMYPLWAEISPAEARLTLAGTQEPWPAGPTNVRWGTYELRLAHPELGFTNQTFSTVDAAVGVTQHWRLAHARVNVITPLQSGLRVKLDGQEISGRTPLTNLLLKPGPHQWEFAQIDFSGPYTTNYPARVLADQDEAQELSFDAQFLQSVYTNSLGMRLVLFPSGIYWAEYETTRKEFDRAVVSNEDSGQPPQEPAVSVSGHLPKVTWETALQFRDWLNSQPEEARRLGELPGGPWKYDLPNEAEWPPYSLFAPLKESGNFGEKLLLAGDVRENFRGGPTPGIQHVFGNAAELVRRPPATALRVGGALGDTTTNAEPVAADYGDDSLGFRLVLRRGTSP